MNRANIFRDFPKGFSEETIEEILRSDEIRIERIVSTGQTSPQDHWYDQSEHEWVLLISGGARLAFDGDPAEVELHPGDYLTIPAGLRHRVTWTDPERATVWLAVFYS